MGNTDNYDTFLRLLNYSDNSSDPSYTVSEFVQFCPKADVNQFGAKFMPLFYYINFVLSYLGNGLILVIIYKFEKLSTVTNIFLLNLVMSNILFASSLPFWAMYYSSEWIFGTVMCKMVSSAYFVGFYSSILFLILMTFDRYLAVVHAVTAARERKKAYAIGASGAVWCISVVASMTELVLQNVWEHPIYGLMCEETGFSISTMNRWHLVSYYQQFLLFFLLPLFVVMYCYISITIRIMSTQMKEKCRAIKLIFIIIITFFICWTPFNVVILLRAIRISAGNENRCAEMQALDFALYVTQNIAYLYCCISPVFYTFVGKKFQSHFRRLLVKKIPCLKRQISLNSQSSRTTSVRTPHKVHEY
ncbi:chemokine (C-C motif) receptor 12a [Lampris incognitus]|uniref:chemokine (C-C motif) receptor 12a n=1 Tax=Lampris incognitus TaxID=2546036 RepID=UPI0024B507E8|nr:chemokine (C-C motif) receptor 12a [Lampris incognitus]